MPASNPSEGTDTVQSSGSKPESPDFQILFEASPCAVVAVRPDAPLFSVVAVSEAYQHLAGTERGKLIGRPLSECLPIWLEDLDATGSMLTSLERALTAGSPDKIKLRQRVGLGQRTWKVTAKPVTDLEGEVQYLLHSIEEVPTEPFDFDSATELERDQERRRNNLLAELDEITRRLADANEIMEAVAGALVEGLEVDRCAFFSFEEDGKAFRITQNYSRPGLPSISGRYAVSMLGPDVEADIRARVPSAEDDIESNEHAGPVLPFYREARVRSFVVVPLAKGNRLVSGVAIHQQTPRQWLADEVEVIRIAANRCWESMERAQVTRELRTSERRLRLSQRAARIGSFEWLIKEDRIIWTPEIESLYGISEGSFEGTLDDWRKRVVPSDVEAVIAQIERTLQQRAADCTYEFRAVLPDGQLRWLRGQAQFSYDANGNPERMVGVNIDIDAQKQAEAHLHQQWRNFDTALSNTPDLTCTFDLEGRFTYANRSLLRVLGRKLEEVIGKNFLELDYPPDLARKLSGQIAEVIRTKETLRDQTSFIGADGHSRLYEYVFVPVIDASGEVEAVADSTHDITEIMHAQGVIEDDRRRWRELLLQAPAAIAWLRSSSHVFEWVNDEFSRLVQRKRDEVIGKELAEALPEVSGQGYIDLVRRVYETGEAHVAHEAPVILGRDSPKRIFVNFVCLPTRSASREIDGTFVHATDVTDLVLERKRVEESEERFRRAIDSLPQLVWSTRADGYHDLFNKQWFEYTGLTLEASRGTGWLQIFHPDDLPRARTRWRHSLATGELYENEYRCRRRDGQYRWFLGRATPIYDEQGKIVRWFGTSTDIHDQKQGEAALRKANRELEEFSYVASHDLQEPLRMVNIYTQLILKRLPTEDERIEQYAGYVRSGVSRMEALITDLLTYSRVVHAEDPSDTGSANLNVALKDAMTALNGLIEERSARIISGPLPMTAGETTQIEHVFQNLLSNALKYCDEDVTPEIRIQAKREGTGWLISVQDNGIGFEPEYADRIFGLFKRLFKDEYPGTGLGLAICKRIIERYGGKIWAQGRLGEGSTFYFSLPASNEND